MRLVRFHSSWLIIIFACVPPPEKQGAPVVSNEALPNDRVVEDSAEGPCARPGELAEARNRELAGLGTMKLLEAVPAGKGTWSRVSREAAPADERRWSDAVQAVVDDGRRRATISITDMKALCTLEAGLGAVMIDRALHKPATIPTSVEGRSAVAFEEGAYKLVNFWAGDRCAITIGAPALSHADLVDVAGAIELDVLDALCSERTPAE